MLELCQSVPILSIISIFLFIRNRRLVPATTLITQPHNQLTPRQVSSQYKKSYDCGINTIKSMAFDTGRRTRRVGEV